MQNKLKLNRSSQISAAFVSAFLIATLTGCGQKDDPVGADVEHFLAAQEALERGDKDTAMTELNASIELRPDGWAYYHRAKLHAEAGQDEQATADCKAGMQLDPDHPELQWLLSEIKKKPDRRFQGRNAEAPTANK